MEELFEAISNQNVELVRELTKRTDFDPHAKNHRSAGYMHIAAGVGNVEIGQILKHAGVPINLETDAMGLDILYCGLKHPAFLAFLTESDIDLGRTESKNGKVITLISCCVAEGLADTVEFLLNAGVVPTEDDVRHARATFVYMFNGYMTPGSSVKSVGDFLGGLTRKQAQNKIRPYERIVDLLESIERRTPSVDAGIPLKDVDPKFKRGPGTGPTKLTGKVKT
jgi:ankyrin repeat protein